MKQKNRINLNRLLFISLILLLSFFVYVPEVALAMSANCSYGDWGSYSCGSNFTFGSSGGPWQRNVTFSDQSQFTSGGSSSTAIACDTGTLSATFSSVGISSNAAGSPEIVSWSCISRCSNPCGGSNPVWRGSPECTGWSPIYSTVSCGTGSNIAGFTDSGPLDVENLPISVVGSDWQYCSSGSPSTSDVDNPLASDDVRSHPGGNLCAWSDRPKTGPGSCEANGRILEHEYQSGVGRTLTCVAYDMDGDGGYDDVEYRFEIVKMEGGTEQNDIWKYPSRNGNIGEWGSENQIYFRSYDANARYKVTCEARDIDPATNQPIGSKDYSELILFAGGGDVSCESNPRDPFICSGESTVIEIETDPDHSSGNLNLLNWTCGGCSNGDNINNYTLAGEHLLYPVEFVDKSSGAYTNELTISNATVPGSEYICRSTVTILGERCNCEIEAETGETAELLPGQKVNLTINSICFDATEYEVVSATVNDVSAVAGTDYIVESDNPGSNNTKVIRIEKAGRWKFRTRVNDGTNTLNCSTCDVLMNTPGSEWWERRPD